MPPCQTLVYSSNSAIKECEPLASMRRKQNLRRTQYLRRKSSGINEFSPIIAVL
ncbi:hypothetical protein CAMRE0001_1333 [Campylobacter rectus RM3267]|uniref:Uncharacterized protein n=1 Tax=Campylobacter rectus RM3267 TaxID=553218 RepID=B9D020_CAMRE|nr:hypothetical protein CAMRE0001_1333 [Campylobacter rectus RM3267]